MYLDVVIIGAGPIGITAFNSFSKKFKIRVFSPSNQFEFDITQDSNLNRIEKVSLQPAETRGFEPPKPFRG